eukprot:scaffold12407_cov112-Skeletonema_marinoi.AAC.6
MGNEVIVSGMMNGRQSCDKIQPCHSKLNRSSNVFTEVGRSWDVHIGPAAQFHNTESLVVRRNATNMLVELDEEHTKCGICVTKFSSDRDNKNLEIRKHLPVLSSSQRCDHWEKTSFNPAEPKYHRLLIDLLARAQKYAAAQLKNEEQEKSVDEQLDSGRATSIKREADAVDDDEDEDVQLNACMKNENDAVDNEEYAAAQVKKADQTEIEENETTDADVTSVNQEQNDAFCEDYVTSEDKVDGEGAGCVKRESDITDLGEQEVKRVKLIAPSPPSCSSERRADRI